MTEKLTQRHGSLLLRLLDIPEFTKYIDDLEERDHNIQKDIPWHPIRGEQWIRNTIKNKPNKGPEIVREILNISIETFNNLCEQNLSEEIADMYSFHVFGCPTSTDIDVAVYVFTREDLHKSPPETQIRNELQKLGYWGSPWRYAPTSLRLELPHSPLPLSINWGSPSLPHSPLPLSIDRGRPSLPLTPLQFSIDKKQEGAMGEQRAPPIDKNQKGSSSGGSLVRSAKAPIPRLFLSISILCVII